MRSFRYSFTTMEMTMRVTAMAASLLVFLGHALGQVPNGGFEDWTGTEPDHWTTSNVPVLSFFNVTKSTVAHSGSFSLRGEVKELPGTGIPFPPFVFSGTGGQGFPVSTRWGQVSGYVQFSPLGADSLVISFGMSQAGTYLAAGGLVVSSTTSGWTNFSGQFEYFGPGTPDSCYIECVVFGPGELPPSIGTSFLLDDVTLSGVATTVEPTPHPVTFALEQNYPNPWNPSTTIRYTLPEGSQVRLDIVDLLGRTVRELAIGHQEAGSHSVTLDASGLSSGVYLYRLRAGDMVQTKTMVLLK